MSKIMEEPSAIEDKLKSIDAAKEFILSKTAQRPLIAIICGTGLGGITGILKEPEIIHYKDIPGFPISTAPGHSGKLVFGKLAHKDVVCMSNRTHAYEGLSMWTTTFPVRVLDAIGIKVLIVTSTCSGVAEKSKEGDIVILQDHINLPGACSQNPLIGLNDDKFGPRFLDTSACYDKQLRELATKVSGDCNMDFVWPGVMAFQTGPTFETPAEIKFLRMIGGDVIGMSSVPETIVACHRGLRCLALSMITNICVDTIDSGIKYSAEQAIEATKKHSCELQKLISKTVEAMELSQAAAATSTDACAA